MWREEEVRDERHPICIYAVIDQVMDSCIQHAENIHYHKTFDADYHHVSLQCHVQLQLNLMTCTWQDQVH